VKQRLVEGFMVLLIVAVVTAIFFPYFAQSKKSGPISCLSNLKQLGLALMEYGDDHDGKPPPRDFWMDAIWDYTKNEKILHCDKVQGAGLYGYALNAGVKSFGVPSADKTPLVYDSVNLARNASDLVASLPDPGRHNGCDYACYLDGHAHWIRRPAEPTAAR